VFAEGLFSIDDWLQRQR